MAEVPPSTYNSTPFTKLESSEARNSATVAISSGRPINLHGLKGPELFGGVYMSCDRLAAWRAGAPEPIRWIVISRHGIPDWAREGEVRSSGVPFRTPDAEAQIVAARQGLGITTLPCFVGDADPLLVRVPGTDLHIYGTLWLLTQRETSKTKRVRLFTELVSRRLAAYAPLLAGLSPRKGRET